jgi:PAS domain S-box-containing protein
MPTKPSYEALQIRIRELEKAESKYKEFQNALNKAAVNYNTIFEVANDAIFIHDPEDGRILDVNQKMLDMYGYTKKIDVMNQDVEAISEGVTPFTQGEALELIQKAASGEQQVFEWKAKRKDGDLFWVEVNLKMATLDNKECIIALARDITDRKRVEAEQQKLHYQLANALELAHLGHWEYDVKEDRFTFNDQFYKIFRTTAEHVGGYEMSSAEYAQRFLYPNDRDLVEKEIRKAMETPDPNFSQQLEHRIIYADGQVGYISVRHFVVKDENGNTVKTYGVNQDITERKNMERQLQQAQKMESIGILAGGIAHDFNNILSSIIGFTELAIEDAPSDTALEDSLQEVFSAGQRAKELVKQILAFARQSDEARKPIQPSVIANEVLKFLRSTIPTTIDIQQEIESESSFMGNATQVHQVLMNLCTNAAHAMEDSGGVMKVSMKDVVLDQKDLLIGIRPGQYIEIKVSDNGVGIAPNVIDMIFVPYFTTKPIGEGTGMGLAMVHGIIESYGGRITVDSQLGKGSTFTIQLPAIKKRTGLQDYESEPLPSGNESILFVDDEVAITKMASQILERLGYSVTTRTSSIEALELFKVKPDEFDLVITDMTMPNMTGDKLAIELMKIRYDVPIVLCTGYSKKISDETALTLGIKAFTYKPLVKADFAKTIRKVLDEAEGRTQKQ